MIWWWWSWEVYVWGGICPSYGRYALNFCDRWDIIGMLRGTSQRLAETFERQLVTGTEICFHFSFGVAWQQSHAQLHTEKCLFSGSISSVSTSCQKWRLSRWTAPSMLATIDHMIQNTCKSWVVGERNKDMAMTGPHRQNCLYGVVQALALEFQLVGIQGTESIYLSKGVPNLTLISTAFLLQF